MYKNQGGTDIQNTKQRKKMLKGICDQNILKHKVKAHNK